MNPDSDRKFLLVEEAASLESLVERLSKVGTVALDTEADSLHHYYEKNCLIQLSFDKQNFIVDPLSRMDISSFLEELSEHRLLLHGGDYDLRLLRSSHGFRPRNKVFDTMMAAQLLGREKFSLADLSLEFFGVTMSKRGQKSDWSFRPLSKMQLEYAVDDTRYLEEMADNLSGELKERGRLGWHAESCAAMVLSTENNRARNEDDLWRIKGTGQLSRRQLGYVREIWNWREETARQMDRPPFKVLGNQAVIDLAVWATDMGEDQKLRPRLPRNLIGQRLVIFEKAFKKARAIDEDDLPEQKRHKFTTPPWLSSFEKLRTKCAQVADKLEMAPHLVAPRRALEGIASQKASGVDEIMSAGSLLRWQAELIDSAVKSVFDCER